MQSVPRIYSEGRREKGQLRTSCEIADDVSTDAEDTVGSRYQARTSEDAAD
jgi:hypothetical protein